MNFKRVVYYFRIWCLMTKNAFLMVLSQRLSVAIFLFGKVIRFGMYFLFLSFLLSGTKELAGYSQNQTLFIFLTFALVDTLSQFFFREVYRFRPLVVSGGFDLVLTKPMSALFRSLTGGADIIDLITIPPLLVITYLVGATLDPSLSEIIFYFALVINGVLITAAFHCAVLAVGIITLEVDHTIMVYRDFSSLGRFPIEIYKEPFKSLLTFLVPIALMVTLPARTFFGISQLSTVLLAFVIGGVLLFSSFKFWKFALSKYSSASS